MATTLADYLTPNRICFLHAATREETLQQLVKAAYDDGLLVDPDAFYDALLRREKVVTTGIGMGVAIPHAKLDTLHDFFIVMGVLRRGVDWNALDKAPVRLVFMIGGPEKRQKEYLQILSALTTALKEEDRRKKMLLASSPEEILQLVQALN